MILMAVEDPPTQEERWALEARQGSRSALEELHRRFEPRIRKICRSMIPAEAEDVAQEVFLRMCREIGRYDPSRRFKAWIFAVARNVVVDHLRRRGKWWDLATAGQDGRITLWSADGQKGSEFSRPFAGAPARFLSWSPDGRRIAYARITSISGEWPLCVLDLDTEVEKGIYGNPSGVWSPDSLRICSSSEKLLVTDLETGKFQELAATGFPVFWSAEGLYYHTGTALCRWEVSSGKSEELLRTPRLPAFTDNGAFVFYWGPADGRRSYATETYPLLRLELRSGTTLPLLEVVAPEPGSTLSVSRDGSRVAFVREREVCVVGVDGRTERRLGRGTAPALSPDGSRVAFERSDGGTSIVHLETGEEIRVQGGAPAWSPAPSSK